MTTIPTITNQKEEYDALDRIDELWGKPRSQQEGDEFRALSKAVSEYQWETFFSKLPKGDAAVHFEMGLDTGLYELDELLPLFGGMDEFIAFMTREKPLSEECIDRLADTFDIKMDTLDRPFTEAGGWDLMEDCTDGKDWRAEMIAHRDAKAARDARREPELAATAAGA